MADYFPCATDAQRIKKFKRAGVPNDRIAEIIRVKLSDLEKHYPFELGFTDEEDLAIVADVAYTMATSGHDPGMTKWWLQVKGGWVFDDGANKQNNLPPLLVVLDKDLTKEEDGYTVEGEFTEIDSIPGNAAV